MSIYENIVYGPRLCGIEDSGRLDELVEKSLKPLSSGNEVKDRLEDSVFGCPADSSSAFVWRGFLPWSPR